MSLQETAYLGDRVADSDIMMNEVSVKLQNYQAPPNIKTHTFFIHQTSFLLTDIVGGLPLLQVSKTHLFAKGEDKM